MQGCAGKVYADTVHIRISVPIAELFASDLNARREKYLSGFSVRVPTADCKTGKLACHPPLYTANQLRKATKEKNMRF